MFDSLVVFFILVLIIPFLIAQIMPTMKWLIAYTISFALLAGFLHYQHLTTSIEQRGNGFVYLLGIFTTRLLYTSGSVGIINRAIVLNYKSRGHRINTLFIVNMILLDVTLIYISLLIW